jgi:hypothetical protein
MEALLRWRFSGWQSDCFVRDCSWRSWSSFGCNLHHMSGIEGHTESRDNQCRTRPRAPGHLESRGVHA